MAKKNSSGRGRTRNYSTIVYPDSAAENWIEKLQELFIPVLISPLHDRDVNPTGEPKKPHYHVLFAFDGVKTIEQVEVFVELINGVGCEVVNSMRGYARYLCHLDNPEKAQYKQEEVKSFGGADYSSAIGLPTDKYKALGEMQDFCEKYNVVSFYLLCNYARNNRIDWYRILCDSGSVFMREYLKSKKWSSENQINTIVNNETGEIIL